MSRVALPYVSHISLYLIVAHHFELDRALAGMSTTGGYLCSILPYALWYSASYLIHEISARLNFFLHTYVSSILSYINLQYFVFIRFILITFAAGLPSLKHIYIPPTIASSIQHRTGWNSLSKKYLDINPKIFFSATKVYQTNSHPAVASTRKFLSHLDGQNPTPHGFGSLKCQVTHT